MGEVSPTLPLETSGKSLGAILATARKSRKVPIEQTARETRIRVQRIREIENDDFSQFSHPSYVRMFLMDYSRYLGVDISEIRDFLPEQGECGSAGYQYLQDFAREEIVPFMRKSAPRRRLLPVVTACVAVVVCALVGARLWINIDRLGLGKVASVTQAPASVLENQSADVQQSDQQLLNEIDGAAAPTLSQPVETAVPAEADNSFTPSPITETPAQFDAALFVGGSPDSARSVR